MVSGVSPGASIGECADTQCGSMGGQVKAIGQQRHGAINNPSDKLNDHHDRGYRDYEQCLGFAGPAFLLPKGMVMVPSFDISAVHRVSLSKVSQTDHVSQRYIGRASRKLY